MPKGKMMPSEKELNIRSTSGKIRRNIDYGDDLHQALEILSQELNVSTQAIAKMAIQDWVNRHYLAKQYRETKSKAKSA